MRRRIYDLLVNRHFGICQRYHRAHDHKTGAEKIWSWLYLLWLNFAYYVLRRHAIGEAKELAPYEVRKLLIGSSESEAAYQDKEKLLTELQGFDVISFDVFDTLLFRPFSRPEDLFYLMGDRLSCLDFKRIRVEAEQRRRQQERARKGSDEITLCDIWQQMERMTGIDPEMGMKLEMELEMQYCQANGFMQDIYRSLKAAGKRIIFTTDMYLPEEFIRRLLIKNGYDGSEQIFLSSAYGVSKGNGGLFDRIGSALGSGARCAHVGDNPRSDGVMAKRHGFTPFLYPNVNRNTELYRCCDMSPIIGSAYRGLVNNRICCGGRRYSMLYEYGYIYGGLFVTGYCHFIHRYCRTNEIDTILFLSRDGEILQRAYRMLYPKEKTQYVYWSRFAAAKLAAGHMKYDFLRKLVIHKAGKGFSMERVLQEMELEPLIPDLKKAGMEAGTRLTEGNLERLLDFLNLRWEAVLQRYRPQREAARRVIKEHVGDSRTVAAVDIGWAGSGAVALDVLIQKEWHLPCSVTGIVAGTNTALSREPDMSEPFLLSGKLVAYLYSAAHNRDIWKKHDPARNYNVYWEYLVSSEEPSFQGYYLDEKTGKPTMRFLQQENPPQKIREIQAGILDFVRDYDETFHDEPCMRKISGRDAYGPMMLAASHHERYWKAVTAELTVKMDVGL